jgi:pantoate kinase
MATAFAPAHVSGVFAVHDEADDPLRKGSRGAGWSLERGATATVERAASSRIRIDGSDTPAPVTRMALDRLCPRVPLSVGLRLDLPVGQGFGMSAAGTLAACLAASSLLGLDPERALEATHAAEVASGTGLGDAVGSWFGSGEVRMRPGCPPHGWALRVEPPPGTEFAFCVAGPGIPTSSIIRDAAWKERTRDLGDAAVDRILGAGRGQAWDAILAESARFTRELGLLPDDLRRAGESLPKGLTWGQCMLGTSLWATGSAEALDGATKRLAKTGAVLRIAVDPNGARIVRP